MRQEVKLDGFRVRRYEIIGTEIQVYDVYEPASGHGTITEEGRFGRLGTRPLPAAIAAMPRGEERIQAVREFLREQNALAYSLIEQAFPEACLGMRNMGMVSLHRRAVRVHVTAAPSLRWLME